MRKKPRQLSRFEPLSALAHIPVIECAEPLVDFLENCPLLSLDRPRYDYTRASLLRAGVVIRLCRAASLLAPGCRLSIIEGWRHPDRQREQYAVTEQRFRLEHPDWPPGVLRRMVNRYSAPPDGPAPAPHTTGGAVDVWLCGEDGAALDLCSPYHPFDRRSYRLDAPRLAPEVQRRREVLRSALEAAGLTNYPAEYWHWSYGDQGWAYRGGYPYAVYGAIQR